MEPCLDFESITLLKKYLIFTLLLNFVSCSFSYQLSLVKVPNKAFCITLPYHKWHSLCYFSGGGVSEGEDDARYEKVPVGCQWEDLLLVNYCIPCPLATLI